MKFNKIALALAFSGLVACSQTPSTAPTAGIKLVEEVKADSSKLVIPYKKYQLANGLTVLVHEDHSDPLVHVDVTYHVGSAREELGKSGFAHFFEHMMFQGSEHVGDEQHFKIVTAAGGTMNGTTNSDRTNYFETVPANQLETMLWLEADRMGFLLDAVTQEKFEVQRETVKNERGQRIDNRPYGRLREKVAQAMYPTDHPYAWPVIGWMDDLNRVNVNDLKAFFLRWYGPNNATLTIGGDVKAQDVLPLVEKYFASIPQGPAVTPLAKPIVTLDQDRYISMEDNVHLPLLYIAYPTVSAFHADEAPLDVLMQIIGSGKNSLLYQNLVKSQLAVQANAGHGCSELHCQFTIAALPHPASGKTLADLEQLVRASFVEFEQRGVTDDDLSKIKAEMEADAIFGLQSVNGKVSMLANYQALYGNANYIEQQVARYRQVSKADVMRVYDKYIKNQHAVIMSVVPNGKTELIAKADNFQLPNPVAMGPSTTTADDLQLRVAKDNFDRSKQPMPGEAKAVIPPAFEKATWNNGIQVMTSYSADPPTTSLLLKVPAGAWRASKAQAGLAELTAMLLHESTLSQSAEAMNRALEKLGASVNIRAELDNIEVFVNSLSKNLPQTLALVEQWLLEPAFKAEEFDRIKKQMIQNAINSRKEAGYLADVAYGQLLFGDSVMAMPTAGTEQTLANIQLADVTAFYNTWFKPNRAQLIAVTNLDQATLVASLPKLQQWQGQAPDFTPVVSSANYQANTIYVVNKEDAAQSVIRIGKRSLPQDVSGDFFKAGLMNFPLGGAFNSRININLREDKGYTYGARSGFQATPIAGQFTASADVRANVTKESVQEFYKEIAQYAAQGLSTEELSFMRQAINQKDALKYETPQAKLNFLAFMLEHDLAPDFVNQRSEIVSTISQRELNDLAKQHLQLQEMVTVVVGDAKTITPQLATLGLPVKELKL